MKVLESFNCSKGSMCNFGSLGSSPTFKSSQLLVYVMNNYMKKRGQNGTMSSLEQKKENLQVQCKCRVVQILSGLEMCDNFGHKTKETSWPDTENRSFYIYKSLNMLFLLQ